jgi:hypothetical protein
MWVRLRILHDESVSKDGRTKRPGGEDFTVSATAGVPHIGDLCRGYEYLQLLDNSSTECTVLLCS